MEGLTHMLSNRRCKISANTTASSIELVTCHGTDNIVFLDASKDLVVVNAKQLYAWLKEYYESNEHSKSIQSSQKTE